MPTQTVLLVLGGCALLLAVLAGVLARLPAGSHGGRSASLRSHTPVRFRPMERLLREEDFAFLSAQPGYRREIAASLRARRIAVYRRYVGLLGGEFNRLHKALRLLTLYAETDRAETSRVLVEQRILFTYRLLQVHVRLAFFRFGVKPLDVSALVATVDSMRASVQQLSASVSPLPSRV
ncbi:MAG: hypothetical protein LC126_11090 [Bryobacterales bacterium]|nr:hypothetical protein [Bryobacterales bacterium]